METKKEQVKLEIHSNEVNELIGKVNSRLVNYGLAIFMIILVGIFTFSWFIRYPDIVNGEAILNAENAPVTVISHTNGKIDSIIVKEGDHVESGQTLAYIESNTNPTYIDSLDNRLKEIAERLEKGGSFEDIDYSLPTYTNLGELQSSFQTFLISFNSVALLLDKGFFKKTRSELLKNIENSKKIALTLNRQKQLYLNDLELAKQDYDAIALLYDKKVISPLEFRQEKSKFLGKNIPVENINASLSNNNSSVNADIKALIKMDQDLLSTKLEFLQNLKSLRNDISLWRRKFVVTAPITGTISLSDVVEAGKNSISNENLFYVIPSNDKYYAEMWLSQINFGKVKLGQLVKLKLQSFPYQEYGAIDGEVSFISKIAKDGVFLVKARFPKLVTDEGKEIGFRNGFKASGEIITDRSRLLEKMFTSFKSIYKRN